jgi:hypothetical protein
MPGELYHANDDEAPQDLAACRHCGLRLLRPDLPPHQHSCRSYLARAHTHGRKQKRRRGNRGKRPEGTPRHPRSSSTTSSTLEQPEPKGTAPPSTPTLRRIRHFRIGHQPGTVAPEQSSPPPHPPSSTLAAPSPPLLAV